MGGSGAEGSEGAGDIKGADDCASPMSVYKSVLLKHAEFASPISPTIFLSGMQEPHTCDVLKQGILCNCVQFGANEQSTALIADIAIAVVCRKLAAFDESAPTTDCSSATWRAVALACGNTETAVETLENACKPSKIWEKLVSINSVAF